MVGVEYGPAKKKVPNPPTASPTLAVHSGVPSVAFKATKLRTTAGDLNSHDIVQTMSSAATTLERPGNPSCFSQSSLGFSSQASNSPVSKETPSRFGPCHWGQSS